MSKRKRPSHPQPLPLAGLVGPRLRELREAEQMTQDQLAAHLRTNGLSWQRSTVAKVERGERAVSLEELVLLAMMFDARIADLLPPDGEVALTPRTSVAVSDLAGFLKGGQTNLLRLDSPFQREAVPAAIDAMKRMARRLESRWPKLSWTDFRAAQAAAVGDAERKGARSIGVDPTELAIAARRLYGRDMPEERDARIGARLRADAGPATIRAVRGHVTRELLEEIKHEIDESKRRARRKR